MCMCTSNLSMSTNKMFPLLYFWGTKKMICCAVQVPYTCLSLVARVSICENIPKSIFIYLSIMYALAM